MKQLCVIIKGRVIGVSFRVWTKSQADFLGLTGYVKNIDDQVEAIFQGDEDKINKMFKLLKIGPPSSRIDKIKVIPKNINEKFSSFSIKY